MRSVSLASFVLMLATSACYRPISGVVRSFGVLLPHDPRLRTVSPRSRQTARAVQRLAPESDSAEHAIAEVRVSHAAVASHPEQLLVVTSWSAPFVSTDSLIIDRRTFAPVRETLVNGGDRYEYRYSSSRVVGSVKKSASMLRPIDQRLETPVFAFNEIEPIIEALRYAPGFNVVIPLFSEVDGSVERDTLTVLNTDAASRKTAVWRVRFADPAITTVYAVDSRSGAIQAITTRNRRTGTEYHFRTRDRGGERVPP